ncbi:MAG: flagellar basal body rod C-terminal domain-containing protein [Woeseiaceae bacterium]|nr:flagellar basal body rod C-terminal domain-containing protein [Woeseiaceae bacterium]
MPIKTALSGLNAAQLGLRTAAHNIANAGTDGFKAKQPDSPDTKLTGPDDERSAVTRASDVDLARQLIDMMEYSRQVEIQMKTIRTASENDDAVMKMLDRREDAQ